MSSPALILPVMTALAFTGAGAANAFDLGGTAKSFDEWGYPRAWRFVTAILEVAGAAMLIAPRMRGAGVALLGLVIVGALLTLLRACFSFTHYAATCTASDAP